MPRASLDWSTNLRTLTERTIADLKVMDPHDAHQVLAAVSATLAHTADRRRGPLLVACLVDLCQQAVDVLHARVPAVTCACHRIAWAHLGALARSINREPTAAFAEWVAVVCRTFSSAHPQAPGAHAAALMRASPSKVWSMPMLARHVQVPTATLRRDFRARFGMRASRYLQLVRAARAVALLGTDRKVEAVAWDVGYRSKKDLYAALRRWAGGTPNAVRALSDEERAWLERILVRRSISAAAGGDALARRARRASLPPRRRLRRAPRQRR